MTKNKTFLLNHSLACASYAIYLAIHIGVRGGGSRGGAAAPPGLENFQGKLCFQGKHNFLKNPE